MFRHSNMTNKMIDKTNGLKKARMEIIPPPIDGIGTLYDISLAKLDFFGCLRFGY